MLWLILAVLVLFPSVGQAATKTAASCNNTSAQPDVRTAVASAVDGDTVIIPAGTCTWTLWLDSIGGVFGPPYDGSLYHKNIKIVGGGASFSFMNKTRLGVLASECASGQTTYTCIIDGIDYATAYASDFVENLIRWDMAQPTGGFIPEISNIIFVGGGSHANKGVLTFRENNSSLRLHHTAHFPQTQSAVIVDGNILGVGDHNFFNCDDTFCIYTFLKTYNPGGAGSGGYGDQSYAAATPLGTINNFFWEDNVFFKSSFTSSPYCCDGWNGSRVVYRHNQFVCVVIDWHGTESGGRERGTVLFEIYDNTFSCSSNTSGNGTFPSLLGARSGTGVITDNTITYSSLTLDTFFDMRNYRAEGGISPAFGQCDGTNGWDQNGGGAFPGYRCLDQFGVGGPSDLITGDIGSQVNSILGGTTWPRQPSQPAYIWNTTCTSGCTSTVPVSHDTTDIQLNRDYFLTAKPGYSKYTYPHPFNMTGSSALTKKLNFSTARCEYSSAWTKWSLPSTGQMTPLCLPGTNVIYGVLGAAAGTASTASTHFRLPSDFLSTQPMDVVVEYTGSMNSPTAMNIRTQVAIACVADGQSMFPSSYTVNVANASVPGTAGAKGSVAFQNVNVANCAAGNHVVLKLDRLGTDPGDTYTWEARYVNVELTYRRTGP